MNGLEIKKNRKKLGLTQLELAKLADYGNLRINFKTASKTASQKSINSRN